ncbi:hypothetical protein MH1LPH_23380 [Lactiplantibacillus brownii]
MNIQKITAKNQRNQLKVHKLPRIRLPNDQGLQAKHEYQHVQDPMPRIDNIVININMMGMKKRSDPIK